MAETESWPKYYTNLSYSEESSLNTLDVCLPRPASADDTNRYWVIYIHGGAWRDPDIDASSFDKTRNMLLKSPVSDRIAGYASVNYRLSSYPSHPTDPSDPSDPARNARHPEHINDVLTAILYLQETYEFEDRYVLAGHSCGAALAFQVAMKRYWGAQYESTFALELNVVPPLAIVGLEGIYDIPAFVRNHEDQPVYEDFIYNAFGPTDWAAASPTYGKYGETWADGRFVVLGHSEEDTLVEPQQASLQTQALQTSSWTSPEDGRRICEVLNLRGDHDEIWQTEEAAKAIQHAIQRLSESI